MAQQGGGDANWPLNYDGGSAFHMPTSADDLDGLLDMGSLPQHPYDTWSSNDGPNAASAYGNQTQNSGQYPLGGQQVNPEFAQFVGASQLTPGAAAAPTQQGWPPYPLSSHANLSSAPVFSTSDHGTPHSFDATVPTHNFTGFVPGSFGDNQGFPTPNNAIGDVTFLQGQVNPNAHWQHQQQLPQQQQQQQQAQKPGAFAFAGPGVSASSTTASGPVLSSAPGQTTRTPNVNQQHVSLTAGVVGYQGSDQSWQGHLGGYGDATAAPQRMQPMEQYQKLQLQQQQQQQQQQRQLQQALPGQPHSQPQQQLSFQPHKAVPPHGTPPASSSPPAPVIATKAAKAPKVTKPKAPKVTKAKQAAQVAHATQQEQQLQQTQPEQSEQAFHQQTNLHPGQQAMPQQQQNAPQHLPAIAGGYGQPPSQQQGHMVAPVGWQHRNHALSNLENAQFGGPLHQEPLQQSLVANANVMQQVWPGTQQFVQSEQALSQHPEQRQPQPQPQQNREVYQAQQQQHRQEPMQQQRQQQLQHMQQVQQKQELLLQQQQLMAARAGNAAVTNQSPQNLSTVQGIQRPLSQMAASAANGTPHPDSVSVPQESTKPQSLPPAAGTPPVPTAVQPAPTTHASQAVPANSSAAASAPVRFKAVKSGLKRASAVDVLPQPIPHLVSAADTLERQQLFPGAPHLALGNIVEIEPPLTSAEPAVLPDPSKDLGRKSFPGRKASLPCEIIATYDRLISSQPPEKKDALLNELRSKLKSQGKILPPKVYKFASLGDQPKKAPKATAQGSAAIDSPDSADEEEEEEVRSATRPEDPADAAAWDAIGLVHVEDHGPSTIKRAVKNFGDFIKGLYDGIKEAKEKLKKAEESKAKESDVDQLKKALAAKQELLFRAVDAADEKGHEQVLENLGGNGPLVANLVSALRDCVNASDFTGKLPKTLLRFMSQFTTVTDEMLNQRLKFDKIQKRFMTKGDDEVKGLVGEIVSKTIHTKSTTPPAPAASTRPQKSETSAKAPKPASKVSPDSGSSKRPREDESDSRSAKKIATNPTSAASQLVAKPTSSLGVTASASAPAKPWAGTALLPGKIRPATKPPAAKADATKLELSSVASKVDTVAKEAGKPSATSFPSKKEAAASDTAKKSEEAGSAAVVATAAASAPVASAVAKARKAASAKVELPPSLASQSKLGALLEEISKPKSVTPAAPTPDSSSESNSSSETADEKAKRLRKAKRRQMRVSWKPDDELTQVRIFTKDKDEDGGRAKNLLRDAGDDRSEGLALKQSLKKGIHFEDEDEDVQNVYEEDEEDELPYRPWFEPSPVDFSVIPAEKRAQTFVTRGGDLVVQTPEQKAMAERENTVLMAIYTDPSDIPPTPKSPTLSHSERPSDKSSAGGAAGTTLPTNDAKIQELQARWNEERTMGATWAAWNAINRVDASNKQKQQQQVAQQSATGSAKHNSVPSTVTGSGATKSSTNTFAGPRAEEVVRLLTSDAVKGHKTTPGFLQPQASPRQDYADPAVQKAYIALESVSQQLKSKPFPPTEPPGYITDPARIKEWWTGYNRDKQREQSQTESLARQPFATQPGPQQDQQTPDAAAAWAAYYAQFTPQQQQQQQQQGASSVDQNAYAQYLASYYQQQQQQAKPQAAPQATQAVDANAQLQMLLATLGRTAQPSQPAAAPTVATSQNNAQLQALLAAISHNGGSGTQPGAAPYAANPTSPADSNQAFMLSLAQWAASQQQTAEKPSATSAAAGSIPAADKPYQPESHRPGISGGPNVRNRHDREWDRDRERDSEGQDPSVPSHLRGINRALIGTKACVFWASGKCAKGDKCTFRHD
ncbi:c-x8-c-x5-c-x3-h type zinc finger protein [Niveomyces insectorum RCEF 264]|uniref:C-x8-c-x5-c-x3-h type zinc finger protein n=1 Tax=Niveomyces insectorum RCEF 264 TaxID=1081102 RepID=A0A168A052_9HYPO|nr:c-x8-c-x5-c-x3-h type zinc finger protein [Niveomyces insectorum RCEF 264]